MTTKPSFGTPITAAGGSLRHRLIFASLCQAAGGVRMENLVDRAVGALPSDGPKYVPDGVQMDIGPASGVGVTFAPPMPALVDLALGPFSFAALIRPTINFSSGGGLAARNDGNSVGAGWQIPCNTVSVGLAIERTSVNFAAYTGTPNFVTGRPVWVAVTYQGDLVAANTRVYFNGVSQTLSTATNGSGTQPTDAARAFILGATIFTHLGIGFGRFGGVVVAAYLWRRALTSAEVLRLLSDPYPFFDRPSLVLPIADAGGVGPGPATTGFPALFFDL